MKKTTLAVLLSLGLIFTLTTLPLEAKAAGETTWTIDTSWSGTGDNTRIINDNLDLDLWEDYIYINSFGNGWNYGEYDRYDVISGKKSDSIYPIFVDENTIEITGDGHDIKENDRGYWYKDVNLDNIEKLEWNAYAENNLNNTVQAEVWIDNAKSGGDVLWSNGLNTDPDVNITKNVGGYTGIHTLFFVAINNYPFGDAAMGSYKFYNLWQHSYYSSGSWTSDWKDWDQEEVWHDNLVLNVSQLGGGIDVTVETTDNSGGSMTIDDSVTYSISSTGEVVKDLSSLSSGKYTRIKYEMSRSASGESPNISSYEINISGNPDGPEQPENLDVSGANDREPTFSWNYLNENSPDPQENFHIQISPDNNWTDSFHEVNLADNSENYTKYLENLNSGTRYYYRLRTYDNEAWSLWSYDNFLVDVVLRAFIDNPTDGASYTPGEEIQFYSSYDYTGVENLEWYWDWTSDGTWDNYSEDPTHTYPNSGTYTVTLMIKEENTISDTESITIDISTDDDDDGGGGGGGILPSYDEDAQEEGPLGLPQGLLFLPVFGTIPLGLLLGGGALGLWWYSGRTRSKTPKYFAYFLFGLIIFLTANMGELI